MEGTGEDVDSSLGTDQGDCFLSAVIKDGGRDP